MKLLNRLVYPFIDLLIYSNHWIAACALAMVCQTELILTGKISLNKLNGFVFFGTLFVYALHRVIGIDKVPAFQESGRYLIVAKFKNHILVYAAFSLLICGWLFLHLSHYLQWMVILPALISLGYVVPFLAGNKRLRDLDFLKIFLIGPVWGWVTVLLPAIAIGLWPNIPVGLMVAEKVFFIFAVAIPFDIRDLKVDNYTKVKTLPGKIGIRNSQRLATGAMAASFCFACLNYRLDVYTGFILGSLLLSLAFTTILIWQSGQIHHDYFFSGLIDGSILLQFLLVSSAYFLS